MDAETSFRIEATDVVLRPYRGEDLDAIYDLTQDAEVRAYLPDWNVPKTQRALWLQQDELPENARFLGAVAAGGHVSRLRLRLAITERDTGRFVGWCCTGLKETLPPPNREIVYAVAAPYRNRGYATQAVTALVAYLVAETDVVAINAVALVRNGASCRVLEQSGLTLVGLVTLDGAPYRHYQRVR